MNGKYPPLRTNPLCKTNITNAMVECAHACIYIVYSIFSIIFVFSVVKRRKEDKQMLSSRYNWKARKHKQPEQKPVQVQTRSVSNTPSVVSRDIQYIHYAKRKHLPIYHVFDNITIILISVLDLLL